MYNIKSENQGLCVGVCLPMCLCVKREKQKVVYVGNDVVYNPSAGFISRYHNGAGENVSSTINFPGRR